MLAWKVAVSMNLKKSWEEQAGKIDQTNGIPPLCNKS